MANITIHDIAKQANVSSAAVSYVINDKPGVSEGTRERIKKIIKDTGYNPNLSSRKLVLSKSFNIHIVMGSAFASFDNLFYNTAIKSMLDACMQKGYNLVLSNTDNYKESTLRRAILQKDVDGVIFLQDVVHNAVDDLKSRGIPYVVLDAHELVPGQSSVYCDYNAAAYSATQYLLSKGHTKIGFVGMRSIEGFYVASKAGYTRAMEEVGVCFPADWMCGGADEEETIRVLAKKMGDTKKGLSAVLCATDVIAVMLMKQFGEMGIRVPEDISVCGIDDVLIARYCTPPLTTLEIDKKRMGKEAVELLFSMIDKTISGEGHNVCIRGERIIERDSVKAHIAG